MHSVHVSTTKNVFLGLNLNRKCIHRRDETKWTPFHSNKNLKLDQINRWLGSSPHSLSFSAHSKCVRFWKGYARKQLMRPFPWHKKKTNENEKCEILRYAMYGWTNDASPVVDAWHSASVILILAVNGIEIVFLYPFSMYLTYSFSFVLIFISSDKRSIEKRNRQYHKVLQPSAFISHLFNMSSFFLFVSFRDESSVYQWHRWTRCARLYLLKTNPLDIWFEAVRAISKRDMRIRKSTSSMTC